MTFCISVCRLQSRGKALQFINVVDRDCEAPKCCVNEGEILTSGTSEGLGDHQSPNCSVVDTHVESKDPGSLASTFTLKWYLREISMRDDSG